MTKKIIILGGEGNGGVVAACIHDMNVRLNNHDFEVMGFLNDFMEKGETIQTFPVLGKTSEVSLFIEDKDVMFVYAIHPVGHGSLRINLFNKINIPEDRLATIIHPHAFIGIDSTIEAGAFIMANSYIGPGAVIKKCALVMANTVIGHNTEVGEYCHISAGAVVSSYVKIGTASDVALNATVLDKTQIGDHAVVGAGAMITKSIGDNEVVVGNPQRLLRKSSDKQIY